MKKQQHFTTADIIKNDNMILPRFLFDQSHQELTNDARILYAVLRDRLVVDQHDENDFLFLTCSRSSLASELKLNEKTLRNAVQELNAFGLLHEERLGQGKPNKIFLTVPVPTSMPVAPAVNNTVQEKAIRPTLPRIKKILYQ